MEVRIKHSIIQIDLLLESLRNPTSTIPLERNFCRSSQPCCKICFRQLLIWLFYLRSAALLVRYVSNKIPSHTFCSYQHLDYILVYRKRPCISRTFFHKIEVQNLGRSLCWFEIHSEPTCQHRSVARLSPWTQSLLLFLEEWQVWYSPWMLLLTNHLKIAWERSGRSGCWPTSTPSLQVAVFAKSKPYSQSFIRKIQGNFEKCLLCWTERW